MTQSNSYLNPLRKLNRSQPYVTITLVTIFVVVWAIFELLLGGSTNNETLLKYGADWGIAFFAYGEWWRLFTSMFIHIGMIHLAFNSFALYSLGREAEMLFGRYRYFITFLLSGLVGNVVSLGVRGWSEFSAGASGGVFGVIGMNLAYFFFHRSRLGEMGKTRQKNILQLIGINLILGFSISGINNLAHIGGMIGGMILGYLFAPRLTQNRETQIVDRAGLRYRWWIPLFTVVFLTLSLWQIHDYYEDKNPFATEFEETISDALDGLFEDFE